MIKVQKNIPIPNTKGRKMKYPFPDMNIGDSFEVDGVKKNTVLGAATSWAKRNKKKWEFTIRFVNNKTRIWRVK